VFFAKSLLDRVDTAAAGQPFDRPHFATVRLHGENIAGPRGLVVQKHEAGPALRAFAGDMRPRQPQIEAKAVNQQTARFEKEPMYRAIYRHCNVAQSRHERSSPVPTRGLRDAQSRARSAERAGI
jgi:hypothetical protein